MKTGFRREAARALLILPECVPPRLCYFISEAQRYRVDYALKMIKCFSSYAQLIE